MTDNTNVIRIANFDKKYSSMEFNDNNIKNIDRTIFHWTNYFRCGYKGIVEEYNLPFIGMDILVSGNIPPGAGI